MAQRFSLGNDDMPPVVPGRSRSPSYVRSVSASQVPTMSSSSSQNNNKPPPVPRNSLIRSKSAQLYQQQQQGIQVMTSLPSAPFVKVNHHDPSAGGNNHQNNNNNNNKEHRQNSVHATTPADVEPILLSKSFTFESPNGVRRKIPVTPVLSTGPKKSNQHHDTLHYRHGTLVFPSDIVVQPSAKAIDSSSLLTSVLNSPSQSPSEAVMSPAASSPPIIQFSHPAAIFNQFVVSLVDHSVLKLCQDGDAGALSRYLSLHHDKVSARNLNATDQTGKSGLLHAAMTGNVAIARLLIKLPGLEVNLADNEGNTALHLASQAGHADVVSLLTLCPNLSIDIRNNAGLTALMKAALQGRVRCTRLLLLAGASPVLRDFGRGLCSVEWARLTGRTKCAEIIDKYMDKMQLNPGLGLKTFHHGGVVASSEPSLQQFSKRSSLVLLPSGKTKDSWVKNTLKKAIRIVSGGGSDQNGNSKGSTFSIASQLTGSGVMGASVLLPGDPSRRSSMPVLPTNNSGGAAGFVAELFDRHRSQGRSQSHHPPTSFNVPRIQVSYWNNTVGGNIPPPPSSTPKIIPGEMRPQTSSRNRQRSKSSTRS